MASESDQLTKCQHVVITVHGIRTFGDWQGRLRRLLSPDVGSKQLSIRVVSYRYGYFSLIAFLIPFLRWLVTRRFRHALLEETKDNPARVDIVAHSFGTHLVAWGLMGIPQNLRPNIHTIILAGSVLKVGFPWRILTNNRVHRVINDCGIRDSVLILNQLFVLFTGMAGRVGFNGMEDADRFVNRYFAFGHSGYFEGNSIESRDDFMRCYWLPLLLDTTKPEPFDARGRPTAFQGVAIFLLNNAEPIKLAIYVAPFLFLTWYVNGLRCEAKAQQHLAEEHAAEAKANARRSEEERERAEDELLRKEFLLYVSLLQKSQHEFESHSVQVAMSYFDMCNLCREDFRGWEYNFLYTYFRQDHTELDSHADSVTCIIFSPDGKRLASGSRDNTIKVWDPVKAEELFTLKEHTHWVTSVSFSPDGKRLVSGGGDKTLRLWNLNTGKEIRTLNGHTKIVTGVVYSPDARRIISGSWDNSLRSWDATTGQDVLTLARCEEDAYHNIYVTGVAVSPDGKRIAACKSDGTISVRDANTGRELLTLKGLTVILAEVSLAPAGKRTASDGEDGTIRYPATQEVVKIGDNKSLTIQTSNVAFSPDGKHIAAGSGETLTVWDAVKGQEIFASKGHIDGVCCVAFSPDGKRIVSGGIDKRLRLWDTVGGQEILSLKGHVGPVLCVAFSPDGKRIASGDASGKIIIWDASRSPAESAHGNVKHHMATSKDGKMTARYKGDGRIELWVNPSPSGEGDKTKQ